MYQINTLYTLNLYNIICKLDLNLKNDEYLFLGTMLDSLEQRPLNNGRSSMWKENCNKYDKCYAD